MSGNVAEWCWDWYSTTTPTGGTDPIGAPSGSERVVRGGSWYSSDFICWCYRRERVSSPDKTNTTGLRIVCKD